MSTQVIAIVGASGSGKTWLGERLSARLSIPRLAIDDFGTPRTDRWKWMLAAVEDIPTPLITESCTLPLGFRRFVSLSILRQASAATRRERLITRGETEAEADRLVRDSRRTPRNADVEVGETVNSDSLDALVERLAAHIRISDDRRATDNHCKGDDHQGVDPFSGQTDTGSPGPFDRYRVGPRGVA